MDSETIANFCAITDATDTTAEYFLSAAGGDLDMAIGLFYESNGTQNIHESSAQLSERNNSLGVNSTAARPQTIIVNDSDSEVEGGNGVEFGANRIVEERSSQSESDNGAEDPIFNTQSAAGSSNAPTSATFTARRLADLFRPPHGIIFNGPFEMARRSAREQGRWLLVTVHAPTDFASQAMNRDLWNSALLQSFIKENFVFVQMIVGGSEERRYKSFYPFDDLYPHVALIDPRTGELVETLLVASIPIPGFKLVPNDRDMLEILGEFIAEHPMDVIGDQRKRSSSSPKLEQEPEPEAKKSAPCRAAEQSTAPSAVVVVPAAPVMYDGPDAVQIQFRLPSGQKHRHRFDPQAATSQIFQTASAVSQIPLGEFKLRSAEGELDEDAAMSKLHNTMLTIIK